MKPRLSKEQKKQKMVVDMINKKAFQEVETTPSFRIPHIQ